MARQKCLAARELIERVKLERTQRLSPTAGRNTGNAFGEPPKATPQRRVLPILWQPSPSRETPSGFGVFA